MKNAVFLRVIRCLGVVTTSFLFVLVVLLCAENIGAQPTDRRDFKEIEQDLQRQIDEINKLINNDELDPDLYRRRAGLYQDLYRLTQYYRRVHNETYAERGLADFTKLVELNPTEESFAYRAEFYVWILRIQKPPAEDTVRRLEFILRNRNFDGAKSDYLNAIRLSTSEEKLREYFRALRDLHLSRGASLANEPEMRELLNRRETYRVWADFDAAIDYAKEAFEHAKKATVNGRDTAYWAEYSRSEVASVYQHKAVGAYSLGEYKIAMDAYRHGEGYLNENHLEFCNYYSGWGRVYLKLNLHDQAIEKFTSVLKVSEANCPYVFELRGEAYAEKGNLKKAVEDYTTGLEKYPARVRTEPLLLKRAKVYLRMGDGEKALTDLNHYIDRTAGLECPQPFLLRAQARRQLGQVDLALVDEEMGNRLAREFGRSKTCVEY